MQGGLLPLCVQVGIACVGVRVCVGRAWAWVYVCGHTHTTHHLTPLLPHYPPLFSPFLSLFFLSGCVYFTVCTVCVGVWNFLMPVILKLFNPSPSHTHTQSDLKECVQRLASGVMAREKDCYHLYVSVHVLYVL